MLAPLTALAFASAAPAATDLPGVWEGTVGTLPVRACFTSRESGTFGAYYYLSQLRLIPLEAEEDSGSAFRETNASDPANPRWLIEQASAGRLTASWSAGTHMLPVRLSRLARIEDEDGPCSSALFHQPRLADARTVTSRSSVDGVDYTHIALEVNGRFEVSFATFALDGNGEAARRINAEVGQQLVGSPPAWFECIEGSLAYSPFEGYFDESFTPAMITRRWLSVAHHWDGFCGGAHPDSSNGFRTFDLGSGAEVDLYGWFNSSAVTREQVEGSDDVLTTLKPAFRDLVLSGWQSEDGDCADVLTSQDYWDIGLVRTGFRFTPQLPHVAQACGEDFTIPFERLRPYLTEAGAANVRALEAELAGRPSD